MNETQVVEIARQGLTIAFMVAAPVLVVALFIGLLVSVFQAVTQVQEMTLTYVPKLIGAAIVVVLMGGWMMTTLVGYTRHCFEVASQVVR